MSFSIELYGESKKEIWDNFARNAKNALFLFERDYMDYHKDRFSDYSLLFYNEKSDLVALLPATKENDNLISHGGLPFGGFLTDWNMKVPTMLAIFEDTFSFLIQSGITSIKYKTIPYIYSNVPAEEDRYALFLSSAKLCRRDVLSVVDNRHRLEFQNRRRRGIKKALKSGLVVKQSNDYKSYWEILSSVLLDRHTVKPLHSLDEITLLHSRFPDNIKLFVSYENESMLAGIIIYEYKNVAHVQYIAANNDGRELCALDLIFDSLLSDVYLDKPFFDFGNSNLKDGRFLNVGLIDQKEGFGARAITHDHYEVGLDNWQPGTLLKAIG